jgi:hypothetical protein
MKPMFRKPNASDRGRSAPESNANGTADAHAEFGNASEEESNKAAAKEAAAKAAARVAAARKAAAGRVGGGGNPTRGKKKQENANVNAANARTADVPGKGGLKEKHNGTAVEHKEAKYFRDVPVESGIAGDTCISEPLPSNDAVPRRKSCLVTTKANSNTTKTNSSTTKPGSLKNTLDTNSTRNIRTPPSDSPSLRGARAPSQTLQISTQTLQIATQGRSSLRTRTPSLSGIIESYNHQSINNHSELEDKAAETSLNAVQPVDRDSFGFSISPSRRQSNTNQINQQSASNNFGVLGSRQASGMENRNLQQHGHKSISSPRDSSSRSHSPAGRPSSPFGVDADGGRPTPRRLVGMAPTVGGQGGGKSNSKSSNVNGGTGMRGEMRGRSGNPNVRRENAGKGNGGKGSGGKANGGKANGGKARTKGFGKDAGVNMKGGVTGGNSIPKSVNQNQGKGSGKKGVVGKNVSRSRGGRDTALFVEGGMFSGGGGLPAGGGARLGGRIAAPIRGRNKGK